jgi:hypothetical protein
MGGAGDGGRGEAARTTLIQPRVRATGASIARGAPEAKARATSAYCVVAPSPPLPAVRLVPLPVRTWRMIRWWMARQASMSPAGSTSHSRVEFCGAPGGVRGGRGAGGRVGGGRGQAGNKEGRATDGWLRLQLCCRTPPYRYKCMGGQHTFLLTVGIIIFCPRCGQAGLTPHGVTYTRRTQALHLVLTASCIFACNGARLGLLAHAFPSAPAFCTPALRMPVRGATFYR